MRHAFLFQCGHQQVFDESLIVYKSMDILGQINGFFAQQKQLFCSECRSTMEQKEEF